MEADNLAGQLLRAVRQAFFFGVEARLPYALVNIARPRSERTPPIPAAALFQARSPLLPSEPGRCGVAVERGPAGVPPESGTHIPEQ